MNWLLSSTIDYLVYESIDSPLQTILTFVKIEKATRKKKNEPKSFEYLIDLLIVCVCVCVR